MKRKLLFICSGNYYRSRFAEMLFNAMAAASDLDWRADSRGIATQLARHMVGPVSVHVLQGLAARGVEVNGRVRCPIQLQADDLAVADLVIAMKEGEHRAYLAGNHPEWADKIEYWNVHDVDVAPVEETLPEIERRLQALIRCLSVT
jgi:protein-tyrosine phosphatase